MAVMVVHHPIDISGNVTFHHLWPCTSMFPHPNHDHPVQPSQISLAPSTAGPITSLYWVIKSVLFASWWTADSIWRIAKLVPLVLLTRELWTKEDVLTLTHELWIKANVLSLTRLTIDSWVCSGSFYMIWALLEQSFVTEFSEFTTISPKQPPPLLASEITTEFWIAISPMCKTYAEWACRISSLIFIIY